ncbi:hypothetical protein ACFV16_39990 [Streptomyces massasporeus]|uniref:hypothetical protein n=1 Tax=Streptomyces massasporeus TaxID=67324 RepID=UPI003683EAAF
MPDVVIDAIVDHPGQGRERRMRPGRAVGETAGGQQSGGLHQAGTVVRVQMGETPGHREAVRDSGRGLDGPLRPGRAVMDDLRL